MTRSKKAKQADVTATRLLTGVFDELRSVLRYKTDDAEGAFFARRAMAKNARALADLVERARARPDEREALRHHVDRIFPEVDISLRQLARRVVTLRRALATANRVLEENGLFQVSCDEAAPPSIGNAKAFVEVRKLVEEVTSASA